ncbi:MAG: DAK2 domain-containing protein [Lachnospiraceae bacterium]|nr:DAK2 domain-containing protein [Lachnospiraceae bacterium]
MFLAGAKRLDDHKEPINELNVFPVPDGDTGTNMTMTITSAVREVVSLKEVTFETLSKAISSGSLRGARGNSGVIMSQLCRGFCKALRSASEVDLPSLTEALRRATETAYKAVMKPKEGTILTVARAISEKAAELSEQEMSMEDFLLALQQEGETALEHTPELLPVLKQAGVVDSGGKGLMTFIAGAMDAFLGKEVELADGSMSASAHASAETAVSTADIDTSDIKFGYCTEFIINLEKPYGDAEEEDLKAFLESIGDSIVCVSLDDIVKIHVHTNHPGQAFEKGLTLGSLTNMKVDNMRIEHEENLFKESEKQAYLEAQKKAAAPAPQTDEAVPVEKETGFVTVCAGAGLEEIFRELGADEVVTGGQTMNPSTEDILIAARRVPAQTVFVFPNNKNIILAAEQAARICKEREIVVVPTTTVPQGVSALVSYMEGHGKEENLAEMTEAVSRVSSASVTYAVRHTHIEDQEICEGDIMALGDHGLLAVGKSIERTSLEAVQRMATEETAVITLYYGEDVTEEDAQSLAEKLEEKYPEADVEVEYGGQPVYYYLLSVE